MRDVITADLVKGLQAEPPGKVLDVWDTRQPRLVLRARPSGRHSYLVLLGRGKWFTLGSADALTPGIARKQAQRRLGEVATGVDPRAEKRAARQHTVSSYLRDVYAPWARQHRRSAEQTIARLENVLAPVFGTTKIGEVTAWQVERWRTARLKAGKRPGTVNRDVGVLLAMLHKAVSWGHLPHSPLSGKLKPLQEDRIGRLRYLTPDEEARLRAALTARDDTRRSERENANAWRAARGYDLWPALGAYSDHLTPIVLLALNTGLRFGELTGLRWSDVDLTGALLTVRSEHAKSGRARHVPLNREAVAVLRAWHPPDVAATGRVFPGRDGDELEDVKTSWMAILRPRAANIPSFRFHDLRHTFASKLVQAGVDLNTVRELLGHGDIKMTLRYAHLAPEHKAAAVARLVSA